MLGKVNEYGLRKAVSNWYPFIVYASRATPGLVPVTLMDVVTPTGPLIMLPELGAVKQIVTLYAPDAGVLAAHGLTGTGVTVGVEVGVEVADGVGVIEAVGVGVRVGAGVFVGFGVGLCAE